MEQTRPIQKQEGAAGKCGGGTGPRVSAGPEGRDPLAVPDLRACCCPSSLCPSSLHPTDPPPHRCTGSCLLQPGLLLPLLPSSLSSFLYLTSSPSSFPSPSSPSSLSSSLDTLFPFPVSLLPLLSLPLLTGWHCGVLTPTLLPLTFGGLTAPFGPTVGQGPLQSWGGLDFARVLSCKRGPLQATPPGQAGPLPSRGVGQGGAQTWRKLVGSVSAVPGSHGLLGRSAS